jgi:structural maintenance of chromosome 1
LEGTIIHKSGLITGGRSSHGNNKKWDERDVQGTLIDKFLSTCHGSPLAGLTRARDTLLAEQRELHQQRARGKSDENLISEISRLESLMIVAKDDLVCLLQFGQHSTKDCVCGSRQKACKLRITGIKDELKHIDNEIKSISPELKKVSLWFL